MTCHGRTVGGRACELPPEHYPNTQHRITFPEGGWMSWTDAAMEEFERRAQERREQTP